MRQRKFYQYCNIIIVLLVVALEAPPVFAEDALHKVVEVPTSKTLKLEDGSIVRLAAIQAPNIARDSSEDNAPLSEEAHAALQRLALGKTLRLETIGDGLDRRGRMVAMAYDEELWLQQEMLREGMAWVYSFEDSNEFADALLVAEKEAETAKRGVWSEKSYAVLSPATAEQHIGEFRIVEGQVADVAEIGNRIYLNFGEDWKTDFTVMIDRNAIRNFEPAWLEALAGKHIRVRGWLYSKNGAAITASHPEQMEITHEKEPVVAGSDIGVVLRN
ncbi:MAG: thermonuclease family protein [Alphaproteobacteria bacterium]|nr:thermonuclease family protein [Alphaproteobacteria bacterium]